MKPEKEHLYFCVVTYFNGKKKQEFADNPKFFFKFIMVDEVKKIEIFTLSGKKYLTITKRVY